MKIVSDPASRSIHGRDALLLLTILLQYHKYESENPYVVKLSILDDEMALTGKPSEFSMKAFSLAYAKFK